MSRFSIVPEMIATRGQRFLDKNGVEIILCEKSKFAFQNKFQKPFIIYDTFTKKTSSQEDIITLNYSELKKLGYAVWTYPVSKKTKWMKNQRLIYRIDRLTNAIPGGSKLAALPKSCKLIKDLANNRVRILGENAGYPHYSDGGGPWIEIR
jgi:hypothetical protein